MSKFSFYDFIAFIVPGGTLVFILFLGIQFFFPGMYFFTKPDTAILLLPFLFLSFIFGHLLSSLGKLIFRKLVNQRSLFDYYFNQCADDVSLLNKLLKEKFGYGFRKKKSIINRNLFQLYEKVNDFLEVHEKDNVSVILYGQHSFFRNASALLLVLTIFCLFAIIYIKVSINCPIIKHSPLFWVLLPLFIVLFFVCLFYTKQRKSFMIENSFRNFIAMNMKV